MSGQQSGMQSYVQRKNVMPDSTQKQSMSGRNSSYEDLKVAPTKASTPSKGHQLQSKGRPTGQARSELRTQNSHSRGQRDSYGERPFYDTDASIGETSTTASVRAGSEVRGHSRGRQAVDAESHEHQRSSSLGSYASGSTESEDLPEDPRAPKTAVKTEPGLTSRQLDMMSYADAHIQKHSDGRNLPYVKGDSYPTTTSGRLSVAEVDQGSIQWSVNQDLKPQATRQTVLPKSQFSHQQSSAHTFNHVQAGTWSNGNIAASGRVIRPEVFDSVSLEQRAAAGFEWGKASKQQIAMRPPGGGRQQTAPSAVSSTTGISTNTAQLASIPVPDVKLQRSLQEEPSNEAKEQPAQPQRTRTESYPPKRGQVPEIAPNRAHFSDSVHADAPEEAQNHGYSEEQRSEPQAQLDYNHTELFTMEYQELQTQPFDVDPNAREFKLPAAEQDDTLATKLSAVAAFEPNHQSHFFASLNLDQWEQAGEWFLDRFGEVVTKLKDARQQKRKAALAFEAEIEQRHGAIGKKRKQIDDALSEMKESGGKVLQSTPKKTKTK